jgi:hypothetical protein
MVTASNYKAGTSESEAGMKDFVCKKSMSERYDIRIPGSSAWGIFTVNDNGGIFSVTSDYGDYAHNWPSRGKASLKEFLCQIDTDYLIGKITNGKRVVNVQKTVESWRKQVIKARREKASVHDGKYSSHVTRELAREAMEYLDRIASEDEQALYQSLYADNTLTNILGDPLDMVHEHESQAVMFAERLWPPFIAVLKAELAGRFTHDVLIQGVTGSF